MEKITLELEVRLTPKELQEKGQEMASAVLQYDRYENEKKEIAADLGAKMKELHGKLSKLADVVDRKAEMRSVECQVELDHPIPGSKATIRMDTGEMIKEEPMTPQERQGNLPLEEEKDVVIN